MPRSLEPPAFPSGSPVSIGEHASGASWSAGASRVPSAGNRGEARGAALAAAARSALRVPQYGCAFSQQRPRILLSGCVAEAECRAARVASCFASRHIGTAMDFVGKEPPNSLLVLCAALASRAFVLAGLR